MRDEPLDWVYEDRTRIRAYRVGFRYAMRCAAAFVESHRAAANGFRLADLLLMKFNQTRRKKPRKP